MSVISHRLFVCEGAHFVQYRILHSSDRQTAWTSGAWHKYEYMMSATHPPLSPISSLLYEMSTWWAISQVFQQSFFIPKPKFTVEDIPDQSGKVFIVTGGNTGLGKETIKVRSDFRDSSF